MITGKTITAAQHDQFAKMRADMLAEKADMVAALAAGPTDHVLAEEGHIGSTILMVDGKPTLRNPHRATRFLPGKAPNLVNGAGHRFILKPRAYCLEVAIADMDKVLKIYDEALATPVEGADENWSGIA